MKRLFSSQLILMCTIFVVLGHVEKLVCQQVVTLDQCLQAARTNHPLYTKLDLTNQLSTLKIQNTKKQNLPQIDLQGQITYQSDVTSVEIDMPGLEIESLTKDQYKITTDVFLPILDGGRVKSMVKMQEANAQLELSQSEVDLYKIRSSVVNIYFGILKVEAQLTQLDRSIETLQSQLEKVTAAVENGVSLPSNRDVLQAEVLRTEQMKISLLHQRIAFIKNLETFTGDSMSTSTALVLPTLENSTYQINELNRPELLVLKSGKEAIQAKQAMVDANVKPILGAFFQAGYGKPGLNFLENAFSPYYIAGLNLKWNISQLYTKANDTEMNTLDVLRIQADEDNFVRNIQVLSNQYTTEIIRYQTMLEQDERILSLRKKITERAEKQLENGVITSSEYIQELNAEERAKIDRDIHMLEINQLNYQLKNLYGFE